MALLGVLLLSCEKLSAQSNFNLRVMAANITSGNGMSYQTEGINIFKGLKPDVVAVQEFRYNSSASDQQLRALVDTAFGTNFFFYREPYTGGGDIPNGIVSRWPFINSGSWDDLLVGNRGFAWAQIDLPGTNDLYVVSVHLLTSSSGDRASEAAQLKSLIQSTFPSNAWIVVAGDCNTGSRTEAAINTFKTFLSDDPVPTDREVGGNDKTNAGRNEPYDYVLPSFSLLNYQVPVVIGANRFTNGLVFDSSVYANFYTIGDVSPVQTGDSHVSGMQHMAVIKDFSIEGSDVPSAPNITAQPQSQSVRQASNAAFSVTVTGAQPFTYWWFFNETNSLNSGSNSYTRTNVQPADAGAYSVVISNSLGGAVSSNAVLTLNTSPLILTNPASQTVNASNNATFSVSAEGALPLVYQWLFNGTNILGATTNIYTRTNVQLSDAGQYRVVITNGGGSTTSTVAFLSVNNLAATTLAAWNVSGQSNFGVSPLPPTTSAAFINVVGFTRGSGVGTGGSGAGRAWGGNGFDAPSPAAAITAGDFVTFSVSAIAGYEVSITSISKFDYRRSGTGPPNGLLQYQINSGVFVDITALSYPSNTGTGGSLGSINLSGITALQNVASNNVVTFRIVNYAGASGGTWYIFDVSDSTASDFAIQGIIAPVLPPVVPPPPPVLTFELPGILRWQGVSNLTYTISTSTNLTNWSAIGTATSGTSSFSFTNSTDVDALRFYRVTYP